MIKLGIKMIITRIMANLFFMALGSIITLCLLWYFDLLIK